MTARVLLFDILPISPIQYRQSASPGSAHECCNAVAEGVTDGGSRPGDRGWCTLREMVLSELVTLTDGQVVRCGVVNLLEDGAARVVPEREVAIG